VRGMTKAPQVAFQDKKKSEVFKLLIDSIKALMRENKEILWGSMVKQTMQRKTPTFNEEYYGYNTFSDLLEDAQSNNIIKIKRDIKSGSYVITGFAQPAALLLRGRPPRRAARRSAARRGATSVRGSPGSPPTAVFPR